jgi:protein-disulfide isomerase
MKSSALKTVVEFAGSIAMIVTCGVVLWSYVGRLPARAAPPPQGGAAPAHAVVDAPTPDTPTLGTAGASVVVFEFSEFECPYCARSSESVLPTLNREYVQPGRVQWAFKHYPLEGSHPNAFRAAETATCAGQQGRFWEMHDRLFAAPRSLGEPFYFEQAAALGLDAARFDACMRGQATPVVRENMAMARRLGVHGTPTFFIGVRGPAGRVTLRAKITGAVPVETFREALNGVLAGLEPGGSVAPAAAPPTVQ